MGCPRASKRPVSSTQFAPGKSVFYETNQIAISFGATPPRSCKEAPLALLVVHRIERQADTKFSGSAQR